MEECLNLTLEEPVNPANKKLCKNLQGKDEQNARAGGMVHLWGCVLDVDSPG